MRVPVLDSLASVGEVRLNGQRTSLLKEGRMYTVGVDHAGVYTLQVRFFWGKEQDRFARRLRLRLADAGMTHVSLLIAEQDIEARLTSGVLQHQGPHDGGTLVEGFLNGTGLLDLSWKRRLTHRAAGPVRLEAAVNAIVTAQEALIEGLAVYDVRVLEGESDRFELTVPPGLEIVKVEGDAVLQWHTDAKQGSKLTVLLRYLVDDAARLAVRFQAPVTPGEPVSR